MSWTDLEERIAAVSKFDASVRLYQRSAASKPALVISLRKSFMANLKWKAADTFGLAVGKDDNAGKVRIIRRKEKAIAKPRLMKTGAMSFDFGHVAQFGERGTLKAEAVAVLINPDTVEVTIPQFDYEDEIAEEDEDENDRPHGPAAAPVPKAMPRPTPQSTAPAPAPSAPDAPRKGPLKFNGGGVMIDDGKGSESITFNGKTMEITFRQAIFLQALAKAMPQPVDRNFIAVKIFGIRPPATAGMVIDQITMDLTKALPGIGLQLKNIKGVGFALQELAA